MNDFKHLVIQAQSGDGSAFETLYSQLYTPVFKYVLSRVRHRQSAEDIVADVFMRFYLALAGYENQKDTPLSYLYTIAKNLIINAGKKKKAELFEDGAEYQVADTTKSHFELSLERSDFDLILNALESLEETQREVIRLKFLAGLSTKEVGQLLGKTEANVRKLESRALQKIRELLKNQNT